MVTLVKVKLNIIERLHNKKRPKSRNGIKAISYLKDKGDFMGSCNRSACLKPDANWYNHGTSRYYCKECAHWLNCDEFNKRDALFQYGHDLCTKGQHNSI